MNNYIILENRAELTTAQVLSGMSFSAIVAGAASASSDPFGGRSFDLGFMSKGFLAVLLVVAGTAVYKNYTSYNTGTVPYTEMNSEEHIIRRDGKKGPQLMIETIPPKNGKYLQESPNMACQPGGTEHNAGDGPNHLTSKGPYIPLVNIDSLNKLEEGNNSINTQEQKPVQMVQMPQQLSCRKEGEVNGNGMTEEANLLKVVAPFNKTTPTPGGSENMKSYLWRPASFNHNVEDASGKFKLDCNNCEFNYISGTQLDNKNYKGVWMRVTKDKKKKFKLETGLKNIKLIRTEGSKSKVMYPIALGMDGPQWREKEWTYISNKFKTNSAVYSFDEYIDFYLIFEDARVGDKLIIEDLVEALVTEK